MPIPSTAPAPVNFPGPYIGSPCRLGTGDGTVGREIAFSIPWNTQGGANNSCSIDLRQNNVNPITELRTLYVDNLSNAHSTVIVMTDTNFRFVVPPLTDGFFPVVTNGLQFTVYNTGESVGDTTNIIAMSIEISNPPLVNENTPGQSYVYINNGGSSQQNFTVQQGVGSLNDNGSFALLGQAGEQDFRVIELINGPKFILTGFEIYSARLINSSTNDVALIATLNGVNNLTSEVYGIWGGEFLVPRDTINNGLLFNFSMAKFENLQIPLFDSSYNPTANDVSIILALTGAASLTGLITTNVYLGGTL